jgi:hypothetical protein
LHPPGARTAALDIEEKQLTESALMPFGKALSIWKKRVTNGANRFRESRRHLNRLKSRLTTPPAGEAGLRGSDPEAIKVKKTVASGINAPTRCVATCETGTLLQRL